jgi:PAS domain S-box-containing protein
MNSPIKPNSPDPGASERLADASSAEEALNTLMNASTDCVFLVTPEGILLAVNRQGAWRLRKRPSEIVGRPLGELLPAPENGMFRHHLAATRHTGQAHHFDSPFEDRVYHHSLYPAFDVKGNVERIGIFSRDVTEQRRAERRMREYHDQLKTLVREQKLELSLARKNLNRELRQKRETEKKLQRDYRFFKILAEESPYFIWALDPSGKTLWANRSLLEFAGKTLTRALAATGLECFVPPENRAALSRNFRELTLDHPESLIASRLQSASGGTRAVEWHARAVFNAAEELDFVFVTGTFRLDEPDTKRPHPRTARKRKHRS